MKKIALLGAATGLLMSLVVSSMAVASIEPEKALSAFEVIAPAIVQIDFSVANVEVGDIVPIGSVTPGKTLFCGVALAKPLMRRERSYGADTGIKLESVSLIDSAKDDPHRFSF